MSRHIINCRYKQKTELLRHATLPDAHTAEAAAHVVAAVGVGDGVKLNRVFLRPDSKGVCFSLSQPKWCFNRFILHEGFIVG